MSKDKTPDPYAHVDFDTEPVPVGTDAPKETNREDLSHVAKLEVIDTPKETTHGT